MVGAKFSGQKIPQFGCICSRVNEVRKNSGHFLSNNGVLALFVHLILAKFAVKTVKMAIFLAKSLPYGVHMFLATKLGSYFVAQLLEAGGS